MHKLKHETRRSRPCFWLASLSGCLLLFTAQNQAENSTFEHHFQTLGYLPKAELDKIEFDSRLDEKFWGSQLEPGDYQGLRTAVRLSKNVFRQGEPIPAFFVVKNLTDRKIGLDMRLDFHDFMTVNSVKLHLIRKGSDNEFGFGIGHMWACGHPVCTFKWILLKNPSAI